MGWIAAPDLPVAGGYMNKLRAGDLDAAVRQIRQLRSRQERDRTGTYYIEGVRIVGQALQAGVAIERCVIAPQLLTSPYGLGIVDQLRAGGIPILELSPTEFSGISFKENLQGIGAVVRPRLETLDDVRLAGVHSWVALDHVGNPGNLGAILRTCDAVGCAGIIMLGDTTDPFHPSALRASMGAIFSQRLVRASFEQFVEWKREHSYPVVGTSGTAEQEYREARYPAPLILLMGSERLGLTAEQQSACDMLVSIPMIGTSDSLNLGVATSIVLYEIFYQHRQLLLAARPTIPWQQKPLQTQ
jgi:RNA methyltransferase, TrmH family